MKEIYIGAAVAGISFICFLFLLITGIKLKSRKHIYLSLIFILVTIACGWWIGYLIVKKTYNKIQSVRIDNPFRARTGLEIYTALFGKPATECVEVINKMDQVVPRLDCCIWLEFKTCPLEIRRIVALEPYTKSLSPAHDTSAYFQSYGPRPEWFKPFIFGDTIIVFRKFTFDNPNRDLTLIISPDSTHAFYCDMAD